MKPSRKKTEKLPNKKPEKLIKDINRENEFMAGFIKYSSQPFGVGYPDGSIGMINGAFENLTGYTKEELNKIDWTKTLTPVKWHELEKQKLEELHRKGKPIRYEKEYIRKDGTIVPIELIVHLIKDKKGNPEYYYSFINDITERKLGEEL